MGPYEISGGTGSVATPAAEPVGDPTTSVVVEHGEGSFGGTSTDIAVVDGQLYLAKRESVWAIDRDRRAVDWRWSTDDADCRFVVTRGTVVVLAADKFDDRHRLTGLAATGGTERWMIDLSAVEPDLSRATAPAASDGTVYLGLRGFDPVDRSEGGLAHDPAYPGDEWGRVVAVDARTGDVRWSTRVANPVVAPPEPTGDGCVVGTAPTTTWARRHDAAWVGFVDGSGTVRDRSGFDSHRGVSFTGPPVHVGRDDQPGDRDDLVVVRARWDDLTERGLAALDRDGVVWRFPVSGTNLTAPVPLGDRVLAVDNTTAFALDAATGDPSWSLDLGEVGERNNRPFTRVAACRGTLYCLNPATAVAVDVTEPAVRWEVRLPDEGPTAVADRELLVVAGGEQRGDNRPDDRGKTVVRIGDSGDGPLPESVSVESADRDERSRADAPFCVDCGEQLGDRDDPSYCPACGEMLDIVPVIDDRTDTTE
jgi:outer membrane protein assembly factor BamB